MRATDDVHGLNVALGDFGLSSRAADRAEYSPAGGSVLGMPNSYLCDFLDEFARRCVRRSARALAAFRYGVADVTAAKPWLKKKIDLNGTSHWIKVRRHSSIVSTLDARLRSVLHVEHEYGHTQSMSSIPTPADDPFSTGLAVSGAPSLLLCFPQACRGAYCVSEIPGWLPSNGPHTSDDIRVVASDS